MTRTAFFWVAWHGRVWHGRYTILTVRFGLCFASLRVNVTDTLQTLERCDAKSC